MRNAAPPVQWNAVGALIHTYWHRNTHIHKHTHAGADTLTNTETHTTKHRATYQTHTQSHCHLHLHLHHRSDPFIELPGGAKKVTISHFMCHFDISELQFWEFSKIDPRFEFYAWHYYRTDRTKSLLPIFRLIKKSAIFSKNGLQWLKF